MSTRKKATKRVASKKETRGRKPDLLTEQVWFRLTVEEKQKAQNEATEQGRMFSGHLRFVYMAGRKYLGLDAPQDD